MFYSEKNIDPNKFKSTGYLLEVIREGGSFNFAN